tara:strand:- start:73 stop:399 length:327 start_codon:yes stop_codon:yes gene_type:complete
MKDAFKAFKNYKIQKTTILGKKYKLWIANNAYKRGLGLSSIDSLPKGFGMIFCFDEMVTNSFTMKNTKIPLTIIFLDANFKILKSFKCRPFEKRSINPGMSYKYVIEI